MKLALKSLNYSPELTGIGKYNGEMCSSLAQKGIDVTAIVAPPYYPDWKVNQAYSAVFYKTETIEQVTVQRCPLYVPAKVSTLKRLLHLSSFALSSGIRLFTHVFKSPDVIVLVQPTLFCAPLTLLFAKLTNTKTVLHIQDFEVDALFGLGMLGEGKTASLARRVEKWLTCKFDRVSTISYSMIENAKRKGVPAEKIIHFPNWSDTDFVSPDTNGDALKQEWGLAPTNKVVLYAGNIGNKQGLDIVLDAAQAFKASPEVKFVMVGAGSYVAELKQLAEQMQLSNVLFMPLQAWERVPEMLALADIHLVIQKRGAADAVLPSKLTNILSAGGHAIVTADQHTELGKIQQKHSGIYTCIEPENATALTQALNQLLASDLSKHNDVARQFALQYLNKNKILDKFISELEVLANVSAASSVSIDEDEDLTCHKK
ncbi:glycosyltransferase WbuB [Glaciecola siphonariae]|uniref:Glycosyltransferase WbuB n=1 Tax=Glaciecola siphonariae TaxID=521012 RepID=A0ABV9LWE0_9ALTE